MKKFAKILVILLSVALIIGALALVIGAEDGTDNTAIYVDADGNVTYEGTFDEAVAAASADGVVKLTGNLTPTAKVEIKKSMTIDLNGYSIISSFNQGLFSIASANITVNVIGEGTITAQGNIVTANTSGSFNMLGSGYGIHINHTMQSVYTPSAFSVAGADRADRGPYTLTVKNVSLTTNIKSERTGEEGYVVKVGFGTAVFENFTLNFREQYTNAGSMVPNYVFVVDDQSVLVVKDSYIKAPMNGIKLATNHIGRGYADAPTQDNYSVILDNTTFICDRYAELDGATVPNAAVAKLNFINFDSAVSTATGKVYVKDSYVEATSTAFNYGSTEPSAEGLVTVDNSSVKKVNHVAGNGTAQNISGTLVTGALDVDFINGSRVGLLNSSAVADIENSNVSFEAGTRVKAASADITDVNLPAGYALKEDFANDPDCMYVVADESTISTDYLPVFYNDFTVADTTNVKFGNNRNHGTHGIVDVYGSRALKYVMPQKTDANVSKGIVFSEDGTQITAWPGSTNGTGTTGNFPQFFFLPTGVNNIVNPNAYTGMVYEFDIATDTGVFPNMAVSIVAGGKYMGFNITSDGALTFNGKTFTLSTTEWNNIKIVIRVNTAGIPNNYNVVVNGESTNATSISDASSTVINEIKFNMDGASQSTNASVSIDNIQIYKSDNYHTASGYPSLQFLRPSQTINTSIYNGEDGAITVNGRPYATLDAAIAAATAKGTYVVLNGAVASQAISAEAVIIDNTGANSFTAGAGYTVNTLSDTPAAGAKVIKVEELPKANVYWYFGTAADTQDATLTEVGIGETPAAPQGTPSGANTYKDDAKIVFAGWSDKYVALDSYDRFSDYEAALAAAGVEIIDSFTAVESDEDVYFYPVYAKNTLVDWVIKNSSTGAILREGNYNRVGETNSWASTNVGPISTDYNRSFGSLADGETLVFFDDITYNDHYISGRKTYENAHVAFDLNGFTLTWQITAVNTRARIGFGVGAGATVDVYSSVPGGKIVNYYYNNSASLVMSDAFFQVASNDNANGAILNIGKFGNISGDNLEIHGSVVTASGSSTASAVNIDGGIYNRFVGQGYGSGIIQADAAYMGSFNVSNATILSTAPDYGAAYFIAISGTYAEGAPGMVFNNCNIIADRAGVNGYINNIPQGQQSTMVFNNCRIAGHVEDGVDLEGVAYGNVILGEGTVATSVSAGVKAAEGMVIANKDTQAMPMFNFYTGNGWSTADSVYTANRVTYSDGFVNSGIGYVYTNGAYTGNTGLVDGNTYVVMSDLKIAVVNESNVFTVTWNDFNGEAADTKTYQNGSTAYTEYDPFISDKNLTSISLSKNGWTYNTDDASAVVATPIATATVRSLGAKMNLTLYSTLDMNFYIPAAHFANVVNKEIFEKDINNPEEYAITSNGGVNYYVITTPVDSNEVSVVKEVTITFSEEFNDVTYTASAKLSSSIKAYAEKVLADRTAETPKHTEADYRLIYFMAQYLNAANDYYASVSSEDDSTRFDLEGYKDLAAGYTYTLPTEGVVLGTLSGSGIGMVVDLTSSPTWKITLPAGMTGKAVIDNKTYNLKEGENLISLSILDFDAEIKMTVETADETIAGSFSLANYILMTKGTSTELDNLYNAFYAYIQYAKEYDAIGKN